MKYIARHIAIAILPLLFSCSGSKDPAPEEEMEQVESPVATFLIFPENNTECQEGTIISDTQSRVAFQWNTSENTDSYEVHLENLDDATQSMHQSNTNELVIVLERGTSYRWSVVSKSNLTDETAESETWKFYNAGAGVVNHAPFPADLVSPVNGQTVTTVAGSVLLDWEASDIDGDIASFEIFLGTDNPPDTTVGTTSETEINVDVVANTSYYWFIEVTDSVGNTSKSDVFSFKTE